MPIITLLIIGSSPISNVLFHINILHRCFINWEQLDHWLLTDHTLHKNYKSAQKVELATLIHLLFHESRPCNMMSESLNVVSLSLGIAIDSLFAHICVVQNLLQQITSVLQKCNEPIFTTCLI